MNLASVQVLFSAAFLFIGIVVFYVASLISGHNIYKDLEYQHSLLLTTVVGSILFFFLPIPYVILAPEIFIPDSEKLTTNTGIITAIHKTLIEQLMSPFLLVAFGLGIIFGCSTILQARWEILSTFRKKFGIQFYILSYGFAWDHFFLTLKRHALIAVEIGEKNWIKGRLRNFSVRKEPKQLILEGYEFSPEIKDNIDLQSWLDNKSNGNNNYDCMEPLCDGEILILDAGNIKKIIIHPNGLKKHSHALNHSAQAFFCTLLAFGFLLLCTSFNFLCDYIEKLNWHHANAFLYLERFYKYGSIIFCMLSFISLAFGFNLLTCDYSYHKIAFALNRTVTLLLGLFSHITLFILYYITIQEESIVNIYSVILLTFLVAFLSYFYRFSYKPGNAIKKNFMTIYLDKNKTKKPITKILQMLYDEINLNATDATIEWKRLKEIFKKEESDNEYKTELKTHAEILFEHIENQIENNFKNLIPSNLLSDAKLSLIATLHSYCIRWDDQ